MNSRTLPAGYCLDESTAPTTGKPTMRRIKPGVPLTGSQVAKRSIGKSVRKMNKTESEFGAMLRSEWASEYPIRFESITFHCDSCNYRADFIVFHPNGFIAAVHEVKGPFAREKDLLRLKAAAKQFPYRFYLNQKTKAGWTQVLVRGL